MTTHALLRCAVIALFLAGGASGGEGTAILHVSTAQPAADCRVIVSDGAGVERAFGCGEDAALPAGSYRVWVEQGASISAPQVVAALAAGERTSLVLPLRAAGRIHVPALENVAAVRFVHAVAPASPLFVRQVPMAGPAAVRMPAGAAAAIGVDRDGDAVLVAPPALVTAGRETHATPQEPRRAAVVAMYAQPAEAGAAELTLHAGDAALPPAFVAAGSDEIVAIWYDVPGGPARLVARSASLFAAEQRLTLREGRVATVRTALRPLPSLEVAVRAATEAELPPMTLTVRRPGEPPLVQKSVAAGEDVRLERMPADALEVTLRVGPWSRQRRVDLSGGDDAAVSFDIEPIVVRGRVRSGSEPARASVKFHAGSESATGRTDDEGRYEVVLWRPGFFFIDVALDSRGGDAPFRELLRISESRTFDIDVPDSRISLRVLDEETGQGIANARVTLVSRWTEGGRPLNRTQDLLTSAGGEVEIPPVRPGTVELHVMAEGYEHASYPPIEVVPSMTPEKAELRMRRTAAADELSLLLPGGAPAAGAELIAFADGGARVVWRGTSDAAGRVRIAGAADGALLIARHAGAASAARVWRRHDVREPWSLPPAAPPLVLQVRRGDGRPAPAGAVTLWLDSIPLRGLPLGFATRSSGSVDPSGRVTLHNLPAATARLAVGAHDALATEIPFPWPAGAIEVVASE